MSVTSQSASGPALVGRIAAAICVAMILGGTLLVGFRVIVQSNHVGHCLCEYWPYWVSWVGVGLLNLPLGRRNRVIALWLLALCILIPPGVFFLDRFNLLVPYEEWIRRGMPPKPWS